MGRGRGGTEKSYKRHVLDAGDTMPEAFEVHAMNADERVVALSLAPRLQGRARW